MNAKESQRSLNDRDVHIPQQWTFGQMDKEQVFVGAPGYYGRYDSSAVYGQAALEPADVSVDELQKSNPGFPPMLKVNCTEMSIDGLRRGYLGFACTDATTMYSSTRGVGGLRGNPSQMDSDTLLLTHDGSTAHLFVVLQGH